MISLKSVNVLSISCQTWLWLVACDIVEDLTVIWSRTGQSMENGTRSLQNEDWIRL